jgi:membrane protease subunit HflK
MMADEDRYRLPEEQPPEGEQGEEATGPAEERTAEEAGTEALARALKGSFRVLKVAMVALVVAWALSCIFYVAPQEVRFKLRFGQVVRSWGEYVLRPGTIHFVWPWEQVQTVSTDEKLLGVDEDFWTNWLVADPRKKRSLDVRRDGYLLTGDANIVHMRLHVRYRVRGDLDGAMAYNFAVENPEQILKRCLVSATTKTVGGMPVMEVLKRRDLFADITTELRRRLKDFERSAGVPLGVDVIAVEAIESEKVKNPTEPAAVSEAFLEAQNAGSKRHQLVEEGKSQSNTIMEDGRAKAREAVARAQGYKERLVRLAQADADRMQRLLEVYNRSPEEANIMRETLYQAAVRQVLGDARGVFVLYETPDDAHRELRLILPAHQPRKE